MLKNIPKIISPDLMKYMMDMGHSDFLILADANFPGTSNAKRIVRMDAVEIPELLEAILKFYPLDNFVEYPVKLMRNLPEEPVPTIWDTYKKILNNNNEEKSFKEFCFMDRLDFYEEAKKAFLIVQTGDVSRYANILLQKGVC